MPSSQAPNIGINYGWTLGESGYNVQMDENLKAIDGLLLLSVLSAVVTAPPGSPVAGDRYIIPVGATGAWATHDGKIAQCNASLTWNLYVAKRGWFCRTYDTKQLYVYSGSVWALEGSLYTQYANDAAAATGGLPVGGMYVNSSTGALSVRLV